MEEFVESVDAEFSGQGSDYEFLERFLESDVTATATGQGKQKALVHASDWQIIRSTLQFYGSIYFMCFCVYVIVRRKFNKCYNIRAWSDRVRTPLAEKQYGWISFLWEVFQVTDGDLMEACGMDALCFLRAMRFGRKLGILGTFNAIWLIPMYVTAPSAPETDYVTDTLQIMSLAHLPSSSQRFLGTVIAAYVTFLYTMYLLVDEFEWYTKWRHIFLSRRVPRNYAVYVSGIPKEQRSSYKLAAYFRQCSSNGAVLEAHIAMDIPEIEAKQARRERIIQNLEHAVALESKSGRKQRHITLNCSCKSTEAKEEEIPGGNRMVSKVETVATLTEELRLLNIELPRLIQAVTTSNDRLRSQFNRSQARLDLTSLIDLDADDDEETPSAPVSKIKNRRRLLSNSIVEVEEDEQKEEEKSNWGSPSHQQSVSTTFSQGYNGEDDEESGIPTTSRTSSGFARYDLSDGESSQNGIYQPYGGASEISYFQEFQAMMKQHVQAAAGIVHHRGGDSLTASVTSPPTVSARESWEEDCIPDDIKSKQENHAALLVETVDESPKTYDKDEKEEAIIGTEPETYYTDQFPVIKHIDGPDPFEVPDDDSIEQEEGASVLAMRSDSALLDDPQMLNAGIDPQNYAPLLTQGQQSFNNDNESTTVSALGDDSSRDFGMEPSPVSPRRRLIPRGSALARLRADTQRNYSDDSSVQVRSERPGFTAKNSNSSERSSKSSATSSRASTTSNIRKSITVVTSSGHYARRSISEGGRVAKKRIVDTGRTAAKSIVETGQIATKAATDVMHTAGQVVKLANVDKLIQTSADSALKTGVEIVKVAAGAITPQLLKADGEPRDAGFIVFTNLYTTQAALQMVHHPQPYVMDVQEAPDPGDIFWRNVGLPHKSRRTGRTLSIGASAVLCFFWSIPMAFISSLTKTTSLKKAIPSLGRWIDKHPESELFMNQLAPLLLFIVNQLFLPEILRTFAKWEGHVSSAVLEASLFVKLGAFMIIQTFFVSLISGGVSATITNMLQNPNQIIRFLSNSLPAQSSYFIQIILAATFILQALEFLRVYPLGCAMLRSCIGPRLTQKERDRAWGVLKPLKDPVEFDHAGTFAQLILYFMVFFVYAVIAPITAVFILFCFTLLESGCRYQFIHNYPKGFDTGGKLWYFFIQFVLASMIISQLTLVGLLILKKSVFAGPALGPLIAITILFILFINSKHSIVMRHLPTKACVEIDQKNEKEGLMDFSFAKGAYLQPELSKLRDEPEFEDVVKKKDPLSGSASSLQQPEHHPA